MQLPAPTPPVRIQPDVRPLDPGHWHVWQLIRDLFPPHARAVQTGQGSIAISWSLEDDPHARQENAAPIVVRAPMQLFEALQLAPLETREQMEARCVEAMKVGLRGYDPYAEYPQLRVITLGD